jgi:hypothetical protein
MKTILVIIRARVSLALMGLSNSRNAILATCTCRTISSASKLRSSGLVPVAQNVQLRVQPACDETHNVPTASSADLEGMNTVSTVVEGLGLGIGIGLGTGTGIGLGVRVRDRVRV